MRPPLNLASLADQRRRNRRDSALVLAAIFGLTALAGWMVAGEIGILWAFLATGLGVIIHPHASAAILRHLWRAVPLPPQDAPDLWRITAELSRRASLEQIPQLHYVPSARVNALSAGWGSESAIALSEGLLRTMPPREVVAVLAHEIGHIRAGDLRILRLAEIAGHLTRLIAFTSLILVAAFGLAFETIPAIWPLVIMAIAPIACDLLILKLSRTREFAADACAAELTGDPGALISALSRLGSHWDGQGWSLIRTHPTIRQRIDRLAELVPAPTADRLVVPLDFLIGLLSGRSPARPMIYRL